MHCEPLWRVPETPVWSDWGEKTWEEFTRGEIMRWAEKRWDELSKGEKTWEELRRGGKRWEKPRRVEKSWEEMGSGEIRWEELRRVGKRWKEVKRGELRWEEMKKNENSSWERLWELRRAEKWGPQLKRGEARWGRIQRTEVRWREASLQLLSAKLVFRSYSTTFLAAGNFRHPPRAGSTRIFTQEDWRKRKTVTSTNEITSQNRHRLLLLLSFGFLNLSLLVPFNLAGDAMEFMKRTGW